MITKKDILAAEGDVLLPKAHGHVAGQSIAEMEFSYYHCIVCGEVNFETDSHCPLTNPIPLTWDEAMKHFKTSYKKHGKAKMIEAMKKVYIQSTGDTNGGAYVMDWWPFSAGIIGNLKAAAICELNSEEGV